MPKETVLVFCRMRAARKTLKENKPPEHVVAQKTLVRYASGKGRLHVLKDGKLKPLIRSLEAGTTEV